MGCSGILKEIGSLGLGTLLGLERIRDSKRLRRIDKRIRTALFDALSITCLLLRVN